MPLMRVKTKAKISVCGISEGVFFILEKILLTQTLSATGHNGPMRASALY